MDRVACRVDGSSFLHAFRCVGLDKRATVCVHTSLSRFGHIVGGAEAVIDALIDSVGSEGTIMMPSYPMAGSMASYLDEGKAFDVRSCPSQVGLIAEVFRKCPTVRRSLHPTNPLVAWGKNAELLLQHHEKSQTPYGDETPYGRLAARDDSFVLMLETHVHSLLHHLQERVQFPNLFLPDMREAFFIDERGTRGAVKTKVMRPRLPYYVAVPSAAGPEPDWVFLQDFALIFPGGRELQLQRLGHHFRGYPSINRRRADLEKAGVLRSCWVGRGEIGLLHVKSFLAQVEPELKDLIHRFRESYQIDRIASLPFTGFSYSSSQESSFRMRGLNHRRRCRVEQ